MSQKYTLVLGASSKPDRYSYKAVKMLHQHQHPILAIGNKTGQIDNIPIEVVQRMVEGIDTVTLYLNENKQQQYYDYIFALHPKRIIFNPGAENDELAELAKKRNIKTMEACTLVLLSTGQY
ncbi:MAG: CoA-binding protein [Bacteroidetes bacterium]|nr:CoA-binding protein [Bacteroidota bacterium]MBP6315108.1 CoA-binding protein [Chitinophagaceae bacterium]